MSPPRERERERERVAVAFEGFVGRLKEVLNDSIDADDAISMLSQHLITRPVFKALFADYDFVANNPVSQTMQEMVELLESHDLNSETETLDKFYRDVRVRAEGIDNAAGKQKIVTELYKRFFAKALPKTAEQLGIVYTPVPIVDFIIGAANSALKKHFGRSLSDEGVHIIDPFTGTGTFIVRLLQSGLIKPHDLARKYTQELHANEILLLAYYIAAINIEATYHDLNKGEYVPFPGIVYTDTFQMAEESSKLPVFDQNSERAKHQQNLPLQVIIGNPPYSVGQTSQNDDNQNVSYPTLDARIEATYAKLSTAKSKRTLYDSYYRAIRWASDRVTANPAGGVMVYVSNGGYIDGNTADGVRQSLMKDFHYLYVYNLRGNTRTAGEVARREGGQVFSSGSRATVVITIAVRESGEVPDGGGKLFYRDIGDYLTRKQKLDIVSAHGEESNTLESVDWRKITPNEHADWINQRSEYFNMLPSLNDSDAPDSLFALRSLGLATTRDAWNWNSSLSELQKNTCRSIAFFNSEVERFISAHPNLSGTAKENVEVAKQFVDLDPMKFKWDLTNFKWAGQGRTIEIPGEAFHEGLYRPFFRQFVQRSRVGNSRVYQLPRIFPDGEASTLAISVSEPGARNPFSVLITSHLPDSKLYIDAAQIFPLRTWYEAAESADNTLLDVGESGWQSNVNPRALAKYQQLDSAITDEDLFFYIYALLHSTDYRTKFAADLKKSLPRIPQVETAEDFWAFSRAGRELADLHLNYEDVEPWSGLETDFAEGFDADNPDSWKVKKMAYTKRHCEEADKKVNDLTTIKFNPKITIRSIPERAHQYRLGSRSAIDWIINQYQIKTHKASQITNDPNDWATEHDKPRYIYDLLCSVVTVSMRTLDIIDNLPRLTFP